MSGFEIVGVVLGVLPLIISTIEDYEKIVDPVVTFRKYSKALQTFTTELNVQRDIFQNECIWILSRFVDGHDLEAMLQDPAHNLRRVLRHDDSLDGSVSKTLGASPYRQLRDILVLLSDSLNEIYEETKDLSEGLSKQITADESLDLKAWRRHMKQKLKLSLGKPALNEKINDLRHRNQAFLAISQQIVRFNASWSPNPSQQDLQSTDKNLEKVQKLRAASKTLYHHLEKLWLCPTHSQHSVNMRLCLETSELYKDASSKMSFDMALTYYDNNLSGSQQRGPVLLAVESFAESAVVSVSKGKSAIRFADTQPSEDIKQLPIQRQTSAGLGGRPKKSGFRKILHKLKGDSGRENTRTDISSPASLTGSKSKAARFPTVETNRSLPVRSQDDKALINETTDPTPADLSSVPDLCRRILESSRTVPTDPKTCIGCLSGLGKDRYTVFSRRSERPDLSEMISLTNMICDGGRSRSLSKSEKWRVAGALSLAVLLYNSTPWLHNPFKSDDVLFIYSTDPNDPQAVKTPHLHSLGRNATLKSHATNSAENDWVKNRMLYCLGIMLLEIEFGDRLENLVDSSKLSGSPQLDEPLTRQLQLLKRRSGEQLGTLYGRMVRMCLDCDFG
ncbi:MAG: hypothetical protein Q9195_008744, partial [Heterodermia aff. obscurata]